MNDEIYQALRIELGESLEFNYLMSNLSKIGVGGVCTYFYPAPDINKVVKAVTLAHKYGVHYLVIGQGNDIVPSDWGFHGLVIKNLSSNIIFGPDGSEAIVDSGVTLSSLINDAASRDLGGLEFLNGYSGTVGGAIYGNYTFLDYSIGDFVKSITVLSNKNGNIVTENLPAFKLKFLPYESNLKNENTDLKPVILTARIQLIKRRKDEILRMMKESLKKKNMNNIGSSRYILNYFKNKAMDEGFDIHSLLENLNPKKIRIGGAALSKKEINVMINLKNARATDIRALADRVREIVFENSNYLIEERAEYIGRW
jgi:UDP-N-acetylmuramate dehydrogenase